MKRLLPLIFVLLSLPGYSESIDGVSSPGIALVKVIFVLGLVVGLILMSAWFAKRSGLARLINNENFKVVARLPLGQKEKAVLVKVGKNFILLGVSPGGVSNLYVYADNEDPLALPLKEEKYTKAGSGTDFSSHIKKLLTQGL